MAKSVMGLFKAELHRNAAALEVNSGPWKGLDDLEIATCAWVSWFNEDLIPSSTTGRWSKWKPITIKDLTVTVR